MFFRQGSADPLQIFFTFFPVPVEILLKQHIQQHQLSHLGGNGAELERTFAGAEAKHHIGNGSQRRFGIAGDEDGPDAPTLGQFQYFQTAFGGTGVGEQYDRIVCVHGGGGAHLHMGIPDGRELVAHRGK